MAKSQSFTEQTSSIIINIDGEKHRLVLSPKLSHSSTAAELRTILSERYHISTESYFLDAEGCRLHIEDEQTLSISQLLNENNVIQLKTALLEPNLSGLNPSNTDNQGILAANLDHDMWQTIFHNCNLFQGVRMDTETPIRAFDFALQFKESNDKLPVFQVTNNSNNRTYMKDKEMQSSFVSSKFFDGGIEITNPFIGIGINAEYLKSKATTNMQRKTYLTSCSNFPRVTLKLDLSYLEPTSHFVEAIDNVLLIPTIDKQLIQLEEVLSRYGHVYPRSVVLGGQLYHTETQENKEEAKKRTTARGSFSTSFIKGAKIQGGGGGGSEEQAQNKSPEQTSLVTFEAVGGDTRLNHDPKLWENTVNNPSLWRIIEQDDYQSVITLLDQQRQEKIQKIFSYDIIKKRFTNATWKQAGITVAGGNGQGNELNQLFRPRGISIDDAQTIYVADYQNHRIAEWKSNTNVGEIVAGGHGEGNQTNQLSHPTDVTIDQENNSVIIADLGNRRVMRWSRQNQANGQTVISDIDCYSLTMDENGSLYVCDTKKNEVRRWKRGETDGTIVAGGNGQGDRLNQLNSPTSIFVDEEYSLYVSDVKNDRVMKWVKDATKGIIVAGGNGPGNRLKQLSSPQGVTVDQLGQIYVADSANHRVMCWCQGDKEGTIVIGANGKGKESNQFNGPVGLSFDREGNLYVVDWGNHRIQKFETD